MAQLQLASSARVELERRWLELTRVVLPSLAAERGWPVSADHCFQRILLDAVCGGRWYDSIAERPAYRAIDEQRLSAAVELAELVVGGEADLASLNAQSLRWRGKQL
nr:GCN5-related N-acetyltransferase [uncultured Sphingosinicella sp.]